jgi:hypothetical protein
MFASALISGMYFPLFVFIDHFVPPLILNAPEGHLAICAINSSLVAFSGLIQERAFGS